MTALTRFSGPLRADFRYPVAYLYAWYESYQTLMRWMGGIAAGILTFTVTVVIGKAVSGSGAATMDPTGFAFMMVAFLLLGLTLLLVLANLLVTYNWLVMAMKAALKPVLPKMREEGVLDAYLENEFTSYGSFLSASQWGRLSWFLGIAAGVTLFLGIICYVFGAWGIVESTLRASVR